MEKIFQKLAQNNYFRPGSTEIFSIEALEVDEVKKIEVSVISCHRNNKIKGQDLLRWEYLSKSRSGTSSDQLLKMTVNKCPVCRRDDVKETEMNLRNSTNDKGQGQFRKKGNIKDRF